MYYCAYCKDKYCQTGDIEDANKNCPSHEQELIEEVKALYLEEKNALLSYQSALVESSGYCQKTRLEETIDFAKRCGFKKLGIVFCVGLSHEAQVLAKILKEHHFEVVSVVCKNGSIPKEHIGIKENEKIRPHTYEAMCNPIMQAKLLNKAKTELNVILGLCVGHDSLFIKYSEALVTTFAVKDRVLAHNPLGAIYLENSYYKSKLHK